MDSNQWPEDLVIHTLYATVCVALCIKTALIKVSITTMKMLLKVKKEGEVY